MSVAVSGPGSWPPGAALREGLDQGGRVGLQTDRTATLHRAAILVSTGRRAPKLPPDLTRPHGSAGRRRPQAARRFKRPALPRTLQDLRQLFEVLVKGANRVSGLTGLNCQQGVDSVHLVGRDQLQRRN